MSALPALEQEHFGQRLRQARIAAGMSLEALAQRMQRPLTKQALSKLEKGQSRPSVTTLIDLGRALQVPSSWLLSAPAATVEWVGFRKHASLSRSKQEAITALATRRVEGELRLRGLFGVRLDSDLPTSIEVETPQAAEQAAEYVRSAWGLGHAPIHGLVETLEEHGVIVLGWDEAKNFDGLSGWANKQSPIIVLNQSRTPDRVRFDVAHELGHLVMSCGADDTARETLAHRFAAALLVPSTAAVRELGNKRRGLSFPELGLLKQRWGLSMQAWVRRALDLGVIGQRAYKHANMAIRSQGWYAAEPYEFEGTEEPALFRRLVWRAIEEEVITRAEARALLPGFESEPEAKLDQSEVDLVELARMDPEDWASAMRAHPPQVDATEAEDWESVDLHELARAE